jgi:hypothetical protein
MRSSEWISMSSTRYGPLNYFSYLTLFHPNSLSPTLTYFLLSLAPLPPPAPLRFFHISFCMGQSPQTYFNLQIRCSSQHLNQNSCQPRTSQLPVFQLFQLYTFCTDL